MFGSGLGLGDLLELSDGEDAPGHPPTPALPNQEDDDEGWAVKNESKSKH